MIERMPNRPSPSPIPAPLLSFLLVGLMYVVDHPRLTLRSRRQKVVLDQAYPDVREVGPALERLLRADIRYFVVLDLDLVTDTTVVDVRYRVRPEPSHTVNAVRRFERFAS